MWHAWCLFQLGRLTEARAALEGVITAESIVVAMAIPDASAVAALGQVAIHLGDQRLAQRCVRIARASVAMDTGDDGQRHLVWFLACHAMADGDASTALKELGAIRHDALTSVLPVLAVDVGTEVQLVRLGLAAGDVDLAEAGFDAARRRARLNPESSSLAGAAAHAEGLLHVDGGQLARAVALFADGPRPMLSASALEDLGRVQLATNDGRADAIEALGRSLELYTQMGAIWDASRVRGRLRRLGVRRRLTTATRPGRGWDALTAAELNVVRLVGGGLTNRQTAARLYVSPHTVDAHLRHVYEKLGINSRMELSHLVGEHDAVTVET
jgi:DNA-binding CsgD family transcriptional regulator